MSERDARASEIPAPGNGLFGALLDKLKSIIRRNRVREGAASVAKFSAIEGLHSIPRSHLPAALRHGSPHIGAKDGRMTRSTGLVACKVGAKSAGRSQEGKQESQHPPYDIAYGRR